MDEVKRKIYIDLFASPTTLIPLVGGLTALLAAWALGDNGILTFSGMAAVLIGVGTFASRLIFGLEKMADRAYQYSMERRQAQQQEELLKLHRQLEQDQDPRTQQLLAQMERAYRHLEEEIREGRVSSAAHGVIQSVEQMFHVCVDYLRRSYELWQEAAQSAGNGKVRLLRQREELITEVASSVEHLEASLEQLQHTKARRGRSELARLRSELDENIRVARQAEARVEALGKTEDELYRSDHEQ